MRLFSSSTTLLLLLVALHGLSCSSDSSIAESPQFAAAADPPIPVAAAADSTGGNEPTRAGEDWPWFLGPRHDGTSHETGLLDEWPAGGPPLVWEKEVGTGYSAPSVRGEKLVYHHRIGREEIVQCVNAATGRAIWMHRYPSTFTDPYGYNNGPRCTPLLTDSHCYTFGAQGALLCIKLEDGQPVWQRDLQEEMTIPPGFFGVGATPVLEGNRLIVAAGGQPNAGVIAVDAATGDTLWENVGRSTWDGAETDSRLRPVYNWTGEEMVVSYSSPIVATFHGERHILALMRHGLVSLDPTTGDENFHYWFRSDSHESVNAAVPVVVDDTIMLSSAYDVGAARLRVAADGQSVEELWRDRRNLLTHWSTSLYHDGHYFGFSGRHDNEATLRCIDAETGDVVWQTDGWDRPLTDLRQVARDEFLVLSTDERIPTPFYGRGSKIMAEGKFIVLSEYGTLALVEVNPERWVEISRFKPPRLHYPSWTAPVLSRGFLYLRCEDALLCYDLRKTRTPSASR